MNSVILYYKKNNGQIDINNSKLFIGDNEYLIQHLTKGGYFSKSALLPFFEYQETTDGEGGQECLFISDEVAEMIVKSNCNLKGKVWDNNSTPIYESIAERNEVKYGDGVNIEWFKQSIMTIKQLKIKLGLSDKQNESKLINKKSGMRL